MPAGSVNNVSYNLQADASPDPPFGPDVDSENFYPVCACGIDSLLIGGPGDIGSGRSHSSGYVAYMLLS